MRPDGRRGDELRPVSILPDFLKFAHGSALISCGDTKVLCTVMVQEGVPSFLMNQGRGWLTAEYEMLPAATLTRRQRSWRRGRVEGRTLEIQRLVGRALRTVLDLDQVGERTFWVDCDVLQADGGTRAAAVTGGWVALARCVRRLLEAGELTADPLRGQVAAVSVGLVRGEALLDLNYEEDQVADVDLNLVLNDQGRIVEIQGTAEGEPFTEGALAELLALGRRGIQELLRRQREVLS